MTERGDGLQIEYKNRGLEKVCTNAAVAEKKQYAMVLVQPYRLVFEMNGSEVQIVRVIEIIDYH